MEFGVCIPNMSVPSTRQDILRFAQRIEELGYDSLWTSDHVVIPKEIRSRYPYRTSGDFGLPMDSPWLEPVAVMAALAAVTQRVRLGVSVLVIPYRNPVVNTKMLVTIDVLSEGRVILGAGVGWMQEEFEALQTAPFEHRGVVTDEYLQIFKELCTSPTPSFQGRFYQLKEVGFAPKPIQKPHPPIWVGGITPAALRRAARLGDGWHGMRLRPQEIPDVVQTLHRHLQEEGRSPNGFTISLRGTAEVLDEPLGDRRVPMSGSAQQVRDDVRQYEEAGVHHLALWLRGRDSGEMLAQAERFTQEVIARM